MPHPGDANSLVGTQDAIQASLHRSRLQRAEALQWPGQPLPLVIALPTGAQLIQHPVHIGNLGPGNSAREAMGQQPLRAPGNSGLQRLHAFHIGWVHQQNAITAFTIIPPLLDGRANQLGRVDTVDRHHELRPDGEAIVSRDRLTFQPREDNVF